MKNNAAEPWTIVEVIRLDGFVVQVSRSGEQRKLDMRRVTNKTDEVTEMLRALGHTATAGPAGYIHYVSAAQWEVIKVAAKLSGIQMNVVAAPRASKRKRHT